jgi:copper resistance protein B
MSRMLACAAWALCWPAAAAVAQHDGHDRQMPPMDMDGGRFGKVLVDQLEWRGQGESAWNAQAWYGGDYDKLMLKTEGRRGDGRTRDARIEGLWDRIIAPWWSVQAGVRADVGDGPDRTWAAIGLSGLAPQWLAIEATAYVGSQGRTAARLKLEYDVQLTQRLLLQPEAEANLYGKSDPERGLHSGLSEFEAGLRLRYEIRRQFAPYVGVVYGRQHGVDETRAVAGLRVWF